MDSGILDKVCTQIYKRYPEFKGKRPKVKAYTETQHLLIFSTQVEGPDGKSMPRSLRVIADSSGKISKVSTSR